MSVENEDPEEYQHQPDSLTVAKRKTRLFFSRLTAELIDDVTQPVDNIVSQGIFIDPMLRLQQKNDKTPREIKSKN